jgi:hypothetical protein
MNFLFLCLIILTQASFGQAGKILTGSQSESYILRDTLVVKISDNLKLKPGDEIVVKNNPILTKINPNTQIALSHNSSVKVVSFKSFKKNNKKVFTSLLELKSGTLLTNIKVKANEVVNHRIKTEEVEFIFSKGQFEISNYGTGTDLHVMKGEVEVRSPKVQTFVPEIIKSGEGFRYTKANPSFSKIPFKPQFKNPPAFK